MWCNANNAPFNKVLMVYEPGKGSYNARRYENGWFSYLVFELDENGRERSSQMIGWKYPTYYWVEENETIL